MTEKLSIAILGTRGIPNHYGGFESCAQHLSHILVQRGHQVTVYCAHNHPYQEKSWEGVRLIHKYNPEAGMGTAGQFVYDLFCNMDSARHDFDIVLHLGYTSDSIWSFLWPKKSKHIVNMDGLEWKRSKYSPLVKKFLRKAEKWAAHKSDFRVADSLGIHSHIRKTYGLDSRFIAYGAEIPSAFNSDCLNEYHLNPYSYDMILARMEPENNIELMLEAKCQVDDSIPLIVIGNQNDYYDQWSRKYSQNPLIKFIPAIYDQDKLDSLRYFSRYYLHGHSVGGTNPSLLEAMACSCRIAAHDNPFNFSVLDDNALYFSTVEDLLKIWKSPEENLFPKNWINWNLNKIKTQYSWENVANQYEQLFYEATDK